MSPYSASPESQTVVALLRQQALGQTINHALGQFVEYRDQQAAFADLLTGLLVQTHSRLGFIGELTFDRGQSASLHWRCCLDLDCDLTARRAQCALTGCESGDLARLLAPAMRGQRVLLDHADTELRCRDPAPNRSRLHNLLALPVYHDGELVALLGLANCTTDYSDQDALGLQPLLLTIGQLVQAQRNDLDRLQTKTALRVAAQQLVLKSQILEHTLSNIAQGVLKVGADGSIMHFNRRFCELLELPEAFMAQVQTFAQIMGFQIDRGDFGHNNERVNPSVREYMASENAARSITPAQMPDSYWRKTRSGRFLEVRTMRLAEGGWVRTFADITEHKLLAQRLHAEQQRLRSLTELTSDWFWQTDSEHRFVHFEGYQDGVDIDNWRKDRFIGKTRWEIETLNMDQAAWAAHRNVLDRQQPFRDLELKRIDSEGQTYWVSSGGVPMFDPLGVFIGYQGISRDITERKRTEEETLRLALFDVLTGLPNRRLMIDRLQQALALTARDHSQGALLYIDLDNFKTLNDTLGHDMGDCLLRQVGQRLGQCVRHVDTVARLGGDEFVVILEYLSANTLEALTQAGQVGKKVLQVLNQPFDLNGQVHFSSPSIGVTLFGDYLQSVEELLKRADLAMYQAKAAGRNTLRFFDPEMQAVVSARAALQADLRHGIEAHELQLFYQAVVDQAGVLSGAEALVRWRSPQRGLVLPADFIDLAEQTGLILPLGNWVLQAACAQLLAWSKQPALVHLTLAVNVSARQFRQIDFVEQVLAALTQNQANPHRLKLELTESMLLTDIEGTIDKMTRLKALGVGFSLDDFGTGYSSLAYLKRLPLDQLKIDQSFVRDVLTDANDAAIARTIITLADSLGLDVIAEGVEAVGQRDFLIRHGCRAFQGYLFGRPGPAADLLTLLQSSGSAAASVAGFTEAGAGI